MKTATLRDYQWLIGEAGQAFLDRASAADAPLLSLAKSLRLDIGVERTHLVLEQVELRRKARAKFAAADRMFFTRQTLEQATSEQLANFKAERFGSDPAVDLCCGIGGDLLSLAARGPVRAVERDPLVALLARRNCRIAGRDVSVDQSDAAAIRLDATTAWHIDPDRRPGGRRTTRFDSFSPALDAIENLCRQNGNAAIKMAPASVAPPHWSDTAELQWIGDRRECKQQVAWFGRLARSPGLRSAAIVDANSVELRTIVGRADQPTPLADEIGRFVYEPHAVVLAARLTGTLAGRHSLTAVAAGVAYLTSEQFVADAALAAFSVEAVLPFDVKRLKQVTRARGIGRLEVKTRGVKLDPAAIREQLKSKGDNDATLLVCRCGRQVTAIVARRVTCDLG